MKHNNLATTLVVALVMLLLVGIPLVSADSGTGDPQNGKPVNWSTQTFYPATQITTTATKYSASPRTLNGIDISKVPQWSVAEVFVTADVSGTVTLTVTPQLSSDAINWASAYWNTISGTTVTAQPYRVVLSADGSGYVRVPIVGEYLRFAIDSSATASQTVTATVKVTLKNYQ
jgi:hypothetical protein